MVADALGSTSATQGSAYDFFVILSRFHDIISRREPSCSTNTNNTSRLGHSGVRSKILLLHLAKDLQHVAPSFVTRFYNSLIIYDTSLTCNQFPSNHSPLNQGVTASEYRGSPLISLRGCHTCHLLSSALHAKTSWLNNHLYSQSHNLCRQSLDTHLPRLSSRVQIERGVAS